MVDQGLEKRIQQFILCLNQLRKKERVLIAQDVKSLCQDLSIPEPDWKSRPKGRKPNIREYSIENLDTSQIFIMEEREAAALFGIAPVSLSQQTRQGKEIYRYMRKTKQQARIRRI